MDLNALTVKLTGLYLARPTQSRSFIVGIDGLSGSGKTTLAKKMANELTKCGIEVMVIHLDDYVVDRSRRYFTGNPEWYEYYALQWDIAELTANLFDMLHQGQKEIVPDTIVFIEGIFLQRTEWREFYDFVLYVECPRKVRYERTLRRSENPGDLEDRKALYSRRYWPGEDYYLSNEQPLKNADLVVKTDN